MRCEYCKFYANGDGECRVNAPVIGADGVGAWPEVKEFEWCGQFAIDDGVMNLLWALEAVGGNPKVAAMIHEKLAAHKRSK